MRAAAADWLAPLACVASHGWTRAYPDFGHNLIEVFAIDTAGNKSAADTTTIFF